MIEIIENYELHKAKETLKNYTVCVLEYGGIRNMKYYHDIGEFLVWVQNESLDGISEEVIEEGTLCKCVSLRVFPKYEIPK